MKMNKTIPYWLILATLGTLIIFFSQSAAAQTVYSADFSAPVTEWTSNTISTANGESFLATSPNGSGNGTNTLNLADLPSHASVTVSFDLYIIQTWDGNGPAGGGEDPFLVGSGGDSLLTTNFANWTGSGNTQAFPAETPPNGSGADNAPRTGQSDSNHLGYGTGSNGDATYSLTCTFAHSSADLDIWFESGQNQGVGDEGWGLDNVQVSVSNSAPPDGRPCVTATVVIGGRYFLSNR
jgi:hypothetical protein